MEALWMFRTLWTPEAVRSRSWSWFPRVPALEDELESLSPSRMKPYLFWKT